MGSRKKARLAQRRITGTPLKIAIVTDPASNGAGVDLTRDVELVKASVLYADEIELVSLGAVMLAGIAHVAEGGQAGVLALLTSLDDETVRTITGGAELPTDWREALTLISNPAVAQLPGFAELAQQMVEGLAEPQRMLAEVAERQIVDSGAAELIPAINSGLVRLSHAGFTEHSGETDDVLANWMELVRRLLLDTKTRLVLDRQVGTLVTAMINEGVVDPHRLALRHAGEAAVGTGFVARLPAFPEAPLDELLDMRADLSRPLGKYRSAVVRLSKDMHAAPFDRDMPDRIDDLWDTEVQPALDELHDGLIEHGLVREIARATRDDVAKLLGGGSALYVAVAAVTSVTELIAATAGIAGPTVAATAKGQAAYARERKAAKNNDLFYLYEIQSRLVR